MDLLVFAGFLILWKALDTALSAYQFKIQSKVELASIEASKVNIQQPSVEHEEEARQIGFERYPAETLEVEEDE